MDDQIFNFNQGELAEKGRKIYYENLKDRL